MHFILLETAAAAREAQASFDFHRIIQNKNSKIATTLKVLEIHKMLFFAAPEHFKAKRMLFLTPFIIFKNN